MKKLTSAFLAVFLIIIMCVPVSADSRLIPGGQVIGLALADNTLTVLSIHEELGKNAQAAGLQAGDKLTQINGQPVQTIDQVRAAMENCGDTVDIRILRSGKSKQLQLTPADTSEGPRLGVYLKEGITGIGTVTYYDPQTGTYGALGHGVNDPEGDLVAMRSGVCYNAAILSVHKGISGKPGQLVGTLDGNDPIGTVQKNTARGIFGTIPMNQDAPMPTGSAKTGSATIRSTVDENGVQEYSVEILKIYPSSRQDGRNMLLKITDDRLLDSTGGIVQGMSGSPLVQDGKLIGAVTHVLVNDPTMGYGIFIENMLDAAG